MKRKFTAWLLVLVCILSGCAKGEVETEKKSGWDGIGSPYEKNIIYDTETVSNIVKNGKNDNVYGIIKHYEDYCIIPIYPQVGEALYTADSGHNTVLICADNEGFKILDLKINWDENGSYELIYAVKYVTYEGEELASFEITRSKSEVIQYYSIVSDNGGNVYISGSDGVKAVDLDGNIFTVECEANNVTLCSKGDESVFAYGYFNGDYALKALDTTKRKVSGEKITVDSNYTAYNGCAEHNFTLYDSDGIYYLDNEITTVINFDECEFSLYDPTEIIALSDGTFICLDNYGVSALEETDPEKIGKKTTLTVGILEEIDYDINACITEFNAKSNDYYVEIKNYSENGDISDGLMKLSIDLNTGNEPDIIIFYCTSPDAYASKGYLVDLYTLMENDDQLSPDDILVREALEQNGSLYAIPPTFTIGTLCGKTEEVEQFKGWTFDDYFSFDSENIPFKLSLFDSLPFYVQSALDWDKGEANFDTELFVNILKAGKEAEESPVDGNEEQIFQYISLKSPLDINSEEAELGEDISLVGYPCFDGMYGGTIEFGQRLGIVSTSENIDGAWELIKTIMYYDRITNGTRSILKPVKEALISELLDPHDETGKPIDPMITQSNIDKYYEVLESCTVSQVYDYNIQIIIYDEFARYCAGQIEAEECAEAIQSRVSIYMSEQN